MIKHSTCFFKAGVHSLSCAKESSREHVKMLTPGHGQFGNLGGDRSQTFQKGKQMIDLDGWRFWSVLRVTRIG